MTVRRRLAFCAVLAAAALVASANAARHDNYPLHAGSAGPHVCAVQWLLGGHRPSVWRSPRFTTFAGEPNCLYGPRTVHAVYVSKYRLGYPLGALAPSTAGRFFVQLLEGKVRRPAAFIGRAFARQKAEAGPRPAAPGYPLARKATVCGVPGVGTHSFIVPPNNWQSDRALDLCVPKGTYVLAVKAGHVCAGCGFGPFPSSLGSRFAGIRLDLSVAGDDIYYAHLERVNVRRGQQVRAAAVLGLSGEANGVQHLHIACRVCDPYTLVR